MFRVPEKHRITKSAGPWNSTEKDGNNGAFLIPGLHRQLFCIASDGGGWEHVSVSIPGPPKKRMIPSWSEMCHVKNIFWEDEDCVLQFHPAVKNYVNYHQGCLHLWKPAGIQIETPPTWMVGPKEK